MPHRRDDTLRPGLRHALSLDELELRLTPMFDLVTDDLVGFEASVRWPRPGHQEICGAELVELADWCGLGQALSSWLIDHVTRMVAGWQYDRLVSRGFHVWMSVEGRELISDDLANLVADEIDHSGVEPDGLGVEVRDLSWLADPLGRPISGLGLSQMGVELGVEELSELDDLRAVVSTLPFHLLKLSAAVVRRAGAPDGTAVIEAAVALAASLRAVVGVDGIEESGQADLLASLGCAVGQGRLWAENLSVAEAEQLLLLGDHRVRRQP